MFGNFFQKREQRKKEIEQQRREEFEKLREKQKENELFTGNLKEKLIDLQKIFREFEETGKRSAVIYCELEEKTKQIDMLSSDSAKFIFKIINNWKINKLQRQREKNKKEIEESEKNMSETKEEIRKSIYSLLDSFEG
ncbi:MAG: hypothetical protein FWD14_01380 [Treponema sp.]|nr:hypothetical protein [Treponema sp.]